MATINARRRLDGTIGYTAQIRIKRGGIAFYTESKTFDRRRLASEWAKRREAELQEAEAAGRLYRSGNATVGDLIERYIHEYSTLQGFGRSKSLELRHLQKWPLAEKDAVTLQASHIIDHVKARRASGAGKSTVNNDLIWLRGVFKIARPTWDIPVNIQALDDATAAVRAMQMVGKSRKRARRPTLSEIDCLKEFFNRQSRTIPMSDLIDFALLSARRQNEITRIKWAGLNPDNKTGLIEDLKHPRQKRGNNRRFKLLSAAWEIIERQPKTSEFVFPYNSKSIGAAFTRACKLLGITDLRFHDLRHEAISRLFEQGYSIQEVQQFSLHESWTTLQRYTHLNPGDIQER